MADSNIPAELINLTRAHQAAVTHTKTAARAGGDLDESMAAERAAVAALYAARKGTQWAVWDQWKLVLEAAKTTPADA